MDNVTAQDLLAIDDTETTQVTLNEWKVRGKPVTFTLRALNMDEVMQARDTATIITIDKGSQVSYLDQAILNKQLLQKALINPTFTKEEIDGLFKKRALRVKALVDAVNEFNELDAGDVVTEAADRFQEGDGPDGVQPALPGVEPSHDGGAGTQDDL